jgi:hypothetical protein
MTAEESEYWAAELGTKKKWKYKRILADSKTEEGADKITSNLMGAEIAYVPYYKPGKLTTLPFKTCVYKTKNEAGKSIVGRGKTDFINKKYYEEHKCAEYNFEAFEHGDYSSRYDNDYDTGIFVNENNEKSTHYSNDIYVDVDNDGTNDFIVEPLKPRNSKEINMKNVTSDGNDSTVIKY